MIWITKDNREIPIQNMSDNHLINTIYFIQRRIPEQKTKKGKDILEVYLNYMKEELQSRLSRGL